MTEFAYFILGAIFGVLCTILFAVLYADKK